MMPNLIRAFIKKVPVLFFPIAIIAAMISLAIGSKYALVGKMASFDFHWPSTRAILIHQNPYSAATLPIHTQREIMDTRTESLEAGSINLPSSLLLLTPYAWLNWDQAKCAWLASNFVFVGIILWGAFMLYPSISIRKKLGIGLVFLASTPFRVSIGNGQHGLFALAFALIAYLFASRAPITSGIAMAIALFKYHLIGPILILVGLQKKYKPFITAGIIHSILLGFAAYWVQTNPIEMISSSFTNASHVTHDGWIDLPAIFTHIPIVVIYSALAALGGGITWILWQKKHQISPLDSISIMSVVSVLFVYHRIYDFIVLVVPLVWCVAQYDKKKKLSLPPVIVGGWILSIWFGEKIVEFGLPAGAESYRYIIATWGWITLGILVRHLFTPERLDQK